MCGEHRFRLARRPRPTGSSPHVRGTPCGSEPFERHPRDHPRMCGEHQRRASAVNLRLGSSPHVRGTRQVSVQCQQVNGIIPACAGNTCACMPPCSPTGDHPRMCGEHFASGFRAGFGGGSSPHVRGTPTIARHGSATAGIIPACAGNTLRLMARPYFWRDHPRMCGEHSFLPYLHLTSQGSSPHVRGTLVRGLRVRELRGIIPACAGNT